MAEILTTHAERLNDYMKMLRKPYIKLVRLRFLQPDGSTAFAIDNNPLGAEAAHSCKGAASQ